MTEEGRKVAYDSEEGMRNIHFDAIYSSPLKRAYETACILKGSRDIEVVVDERIKEIGFGELEGADFTKIRGDKNSKFVSFFDAPELYEAPEGAETFEQISERAADFMKEIIEKHKDNERIMIVAHGALNASIMTYLEKRDLSHFWGDGLQGNCEATVYTFNGKWALRADN